MKTKHHSIPSAPVTQSDDQTRNHSIRRKWFALALGGSLFSSVLALSPSSAEAQCQQWSVGHKWRFNQGGRTLDDGTIATTKVDMNLQQNGIVITGTALLQELYPYKGGFNRLGPAISGTVDGTVQRDSFAVKIYWDNSLVGVYDGTIRASGRIDGTGYEQRSASIKTNWHSETNMVCADAAPPPPKPADSAATKAELSAAGDAWIADELRKRKAARQPTPSPGNRGFINGLQLATPTPTPSAEADESSSNDMQGQHKKNKKNKKKHHHHDDDQDQGND